MINRPTKFVRTLQGRLTLATALPLLVLTIVLTGTMMIERQQDITVRLHQSGNAAARYLASVAGFALYSVDKNLLRSLAIAASTLDGMFGVAFLNSNREVVVSTLPFGDQSVSESLLMEGNFQITGDYLFFERPVPASSLAIDDSSIEPALAKGVQQLGWVVVVMDPAVSQDERAAMLMNGAGISLGILIMASFLSYLLSRNIIEPIKDLTRTVSTVERGDFTVRAKAAPSYEFGILANGINHMVESIEQSQLRLQEEVANATRQLEQTLVHLRLKNHELEITMQQANEANAAKSEFLARMSHELRTPLTSIQGFARILERADLDDSEKQYCQIICQAADLLLQIINDILEFTRLQAGATTLEVLPFDLYECVESPARLLAATAHDKSLELIIDVDPDVPLAVIGDALRIKQIITNLIANAVKFTEAGYVRLQVSLLVDKKDHCRLAISVEDTGIGISDDRKEAIFDAFTQADTSTSRRFGGTGLGLSIVKGLTDLMEGNIAIDSVVGEGTTITAALSLQKQHLVLPARKPASAVILYDPDAASRRAMEHQLLRLTDSIASYDDIEGLNTALQTSAASLILVNIPAAFDVNKSPVGEAGGDNTGLDNNALVFLLREIRQQTQLPMVVLLSLKMLNNKLPAELEELLQPITCVGKPVATDKLRGIFLDSNPADFGAIHNDRPLFGVRALVAEDNDLSQLLLRTILQQAGASCYVVDNGREALETSLLEPFDILLFDFHMPGLNGLDALREIRAQASLNTATPAILLTADVLPQIAETSGGIDDVQVMLKPFDETVLIKTIVKLTGVEQDGELDFELVEHGVPKEMYFAELESLLGAARNSIGDADDEVATSELTGLIHQLLGVVGVFSLGSLEKQTVALQSAAKAGDNSRVSAIITSLEAEIHKLKNQLS